MLSANNRRTSSSESDPSSGVDQKKRKRMMSNRESARRSRARKQQHLDELSNYASRLENENGQMMMQIDLVSRRCAGVEMENAVLRSQLSELTDRFMSTASFLHLFEESSGMPIEIPEMPTPVLMPWRLPYPWAPTTFQC